MVLLVGPAPLNRVDVGFRFDCPANPFIVGTLREAYLPTCHPLDLLGLFPCLAARHGASKHGYPRFCIVCAGIVSSPISIGCGVAYPTGGLG